jgi:2-iminobutanoate/2-iminopropanoate deaminase
MSLPREVIAGPLPGIGATRPLDQLASLAVRGGTFVFVSGLTAFDPGTGAAIRGTTASETRQILENLKLILEASGSSLDRVVKVNVLLHSMLEAANMNEIYARFFPEPPPARTVCGARLPDAVKVMIECTALASDDGGPMTAASNVSDLRLRHTTKGKEVTEGNHRLPSVRRAARPELKASAAPRLPRSVIEPVNPVLNASRRANLPHVPGIRVGDYIFLSGMGPIDPVTGERRHGSIADQVRTTLSNVKHMLESAGSSLERVVRVHVVLADIADLAEMDRVYREFFPVDPPARTAWSMQLRFGNGCEIECVALG